MSTKKKRKILKYSDADRSITFLYSFYVEHTITDGVKNPVTEKYNAFYVIYLWFQQDAIYETMTWPRLFCCYSFKPSCTFKYKKYGK